LLVTVLCLVLTFGEPGYGVGYGPSWHRHLLAHDGERSFVAEDDGRIVGFTAALPPVCCSCRQLAASGGVCDPQLLAAVRPAGAETGWLAMTGPV
jgi:hypothetical protein